LNLQKIYDTTKLAHYDSLTGTPNRLLFNIKLEQALSRATRNSTNVILFFIDLDNFKNINDTYGHIAGDKILELVSLNIKKIIRSEDTFFRISGDEFSLIIEDVKDRTYLDILSKKILLATSTAISFNGVDISISCSIGISSFPKDSRLKEELIHFADMAMYKAKKNGKSNYVYYEDLAE
jgi:diguanylate cyclase (GGDEF)-like protein